MTRDFPRIDKPASVTDVPDVESRPEARRIEALWPLRNIHDAIDGDGIEYAVLTVTHSTRLRAYTASINRENHFSGTVSTKPFDAAASAGPSRPAASAKSRCRPRSRSRCKRCATRSPPATRTSPRTSRPLRPTTPSRPPDHPPTMSSTRTRDKRFVVLGGPGGRLSCRPVGCPMITDRYRRWQVLVHVNRPLTAARVDAAQRAALRLYWRA